MVHINGKAYEAAVEALEAGNIQKSFGGKAELIRAHDGLILKSYNTIVASYINGDFRKHWDGWSATTNRHVNAFRRLVGLPDMAKKEWDKTECADCTVTVW